MARKTTDDDVVKGALIRLYPTRDQAAQMDIWRRRAHSLWNLLLSLQMAAYSGKRTVHPELKWRQKWHDSVVETYEARMEAFTSGKTTKKGKVKVEKEPEAPDPEFLATILRGRSKEGRPRLFLWDDHLKKTMARLKTEPLSSWIADMPSSSCQRVCQEICDALRRMIKAKKEGGDRKVGFPRFKRVGYARGSVYLSNTSFSADVSKMETRHKWRRMTKWIDLRNGVGPIRAGRGDLPEKAYIMGVRLYRIGEQWWAAMQYKTDAADPLPKTGRVAGVKIAATVVYTVEASDNPSLPDPADIPYEVEGEFVRFRPPVITPRDEALFAIDGRRASRKKPRSKAYYRAQARLAMMHARERNARNDRQHKASRWIINNFDTIYVDKMEVSRMMRKDAERTSKKLRRINRHAAMARGLMYLHYKAKFGGKTVSESPKDFAVTQICSECGTKHPIMATGKKTLVCTICGNIMDRRDNAAKNEKKRRAAAQIAAE